MGGNMKPQSEYTEEFRRDPAELVTSSGRVTKEVARDLVINDTGLGNWIRAEREKRAGGGMARLGPEHRSRRCLYFVRRVPDPLTPRVGRKSLEAVTKS